MRVDEKLILEISSIMKLKFSNEEISKLTQEINEILTMLTTLEEVDTTDIENTYYGGVNYQARFRKDEPIQNKEEVKSLLANAIDSENNQIKVPAILDDGEGGA